MLIALLIFGAVMIGVSNFTGDLAKKYNTSIDDLSSLAPIQKIQNQTETLDETIQNSKITGTFLDVPFTIVSGIYQALKLVSTSLFSIWDMFTNTIASYLSIPRKYIDIIMAIISVSILFEIISIVMKWRV